MATAKLKDTVLEWVGILLPLLLLIAGLVWFFGWAHHQAQLKEEQRKVRLEKLMSPSPSSSTYSSPSITSDNYIDNHGTDECTSDCSGHEAGYEYADDNDICDTDYSDSNSDSFNEGVVAWAEDNC